MSGEAVLVTGGTGALGAAVVRGVVQAGYGAGVPYIVSSEWERLETELGDSSGSVVGVEADVLDAAALDGVLERIERDLGSLRALVHLVGGYAYGSLDATEPDTWRRMLSLNLDSAYVAARAALPRLRASRGSMVFVGAQGALSASPNQVAYNVAKAGVVTLARTLAAELRADGVRVNAVVPDVIDTPANRRSMPKSNFGTWLEPRQIADAIVFLVSDAGSGVTGAVLPLQRAS